MIFDTVSKEVEKEKIKAIGARNLLKSYAKQRESQQEQLRALVVEKKTELDRLNTQHAALAKVTPQYYFMTYLHAPPARLARVLQMQI